MTPTALAVALAVALVGSLLLNAALGWAFLAARARAAAYRAREEYMMGAYNHLRSRSHRRHPRTGRLLPLGE